MKTITRYKWQQIGIRNFYVRPEVARLVFENESDKRGTHIQITPEQEQELMEIEGGKIRFGVAKRYFPNKTKLAEKIKEILSHQDQT